MTMLELRKSYPFIAYGGIYEGFKKKLRSSLGKWLAKVDSLG